MGLATALAGIRPVLTTLIASLDWPRSCRTRSEGPAEEVTEGDALAVDVLVGGPWPIGCSSSTSLYHWKSAADAAMASKCQKHFLKLASMLFVVVVWIL